MVYGYTKAENMCTFYKQSFQSTSLKLTWLGRVNFKKNVSSKPADPK